MNLHLDFLNCKTTLTSVLLLAATWLNVASAEWIDRGETLHFSAPNYGLIIEKKGFHFALERRDGKPLVGAHPEAGLTFRGTNSAPLSPAISTRLLSQQGNDALVEVVCENGQRVRVEVTAADSYVRMRVPPRGNKESQEKQTDSAYDLDLRLAGKLNPAFGLGDHGGWTDSANVFGYRDLVFQHGHPTHNPYRFVSTFCLFPKHRLGQVVFSRDRKFVQLDDSATTLGVRGAHRNAAWYWFVGEIPEIYAQYKAAREREGFGDRRPRYDFFGVGLEGYGAHGWSTSQESMQELIQGYLDRGYPLSWVIASSGRWRNPLSRDPKKPEGNATSFGLWGERYPDPDGFKRFLKERNLRFITGTRHSFVASRREGGIYALDVHGPFPRIGVDRGYFLLDAAGKPRTFRVQGSPRGLVYLLDADNPQAVAWFVEQSKLWGSEGFKEDFMFTATKNSYYDDGKINPILEAFDDAGYLMLVRCAAYGVPGSILRINDAGLDYPARDQDRIPINLLCFAASGQPNVYPDIVGGKPISNWDDRACRYLTRTAMLAAVCPSMSFGNAPWNMKNPALEEAALKAARWHETYRPYIFSAAMESYRTGYPATFTPLPVAYPDDPTTYDLANITRRQYSWLAGPSLLACPLFGADFDAADAREVYLPTGRWQDYETGKSYQGPTTLRNYALPMDKMPLFVGRTGILVSQDQNGQLWVELFPGVMNGNDYVYTHRDGKTRSRITVDGDSALIADSRGLGKRMTIVEADRGRSVAIEALALPGAFRFRLEPGKDYQIAIR